MAETDPKRQKLESENNINEYLPLEQCQKAFDLLLKLVSDRVGCAMEGDTFNILLVLTGKREAMLLQTKYGWQDEYDGKELDVDTAKEKERSLKVHQDIRRVIHEEFLLTNIHVISDNDGQSLYIYSKAQHTLLLNSQCKNEVVPTHCFLRYLYPFEHEKFTCFAKFMLNNQQQIYGFGCFEVSVSDLAELRRRLNEYKQIAAVLSRIEVHLAVIYHL